MGFLLLTGGWVGQDHADTRFCHKPSSGPLWQSVSHLGDFEQLIGMINDDYGLKPAGKDKVALLRTSIDSSWTARKGPTPLLIIDEAQTSRPTCWRSKDAVEPGKPRKRN